MSKWNQAEVLEVVRVLNNTYHIEEKVYENYFIASLNDYYAEIKFNDLSIWDSENSERRYIEATDEYEPLIECVLRYLHDIIDEYADMIKVIHNIKNI